MQISPRYDGEPIIALDGDGAGVRTPFLRQRRRLLEVLRGFDDDRWNAPSRCAGWRVREVVAHLADTDGYWALSLTHGLAGEPTRMLVGFDPGATPAQLVRRHADAPLADVLDRYVAASTALVELVEGLDTAGWAAVAEAPPGHLPAALIVHHALWDSWVHERDILLPLGLPVIEEDDEVLASLRYAAALGPAFVASHDPGRRGTLVLDTRQPEARVVVEAGETVRVHGGPAPDGAPVVSGRAVDLLEGISQRAPLPAGAGGEQGWLLTALARAFDTAPEVPA